MCNPIATGLDCLELSRYSANSISHFLDRENVANQNYLSLFSLFKQLLALESAKNVSNI